MDRNTQYAQPRSNTAREGLQILCETDHTLNPWISIWTKPRATVQQIVDTNPEQSVLVLAAVAGFTQTLNRASTRSLGDTLDLSLIFVMAAFLGPIGGIVGLYFYGALIHWTGKWVGGKAPPQNIRAAVAWSSVPIIWASILWIPEFALFGEELFKTETPRIDASLSLFFVLLGFTIIETAIAIWTIVVFLKCLGQVQGFSAWKALGNSILAGLVFIVPILVIIFTVLSLTPG